MDHGGQFYVKTEMTGLVTSPKILKLYLCKQADYLAWYFKFNTELFLLGNFGVKELTPLMPTPPP